MTKLFLKAAILLILFFLTISSTNAQRELNYIYHFKCLNSINGYNEAKNNWRPTKYRIRQSKALLPTNLAEGIFTNLIYGQGFTLA